TCPGSRVAVGVGFGVLLVVAGGGVVGVVLAVVGSGLDVEGLAEGGGVDVVSAAGAAWPSSSGGGAMSPTRSRNTSMNAAVPPSQIARRLALPVRGLGCTRIGNMGVLSATAGVAETDVRG